ncbi:adenylate/guanylate cyclase [Actinomadura fibrosa]|uniref:Adenylate/guanylate cyclase domain-containing protein n=1 Tax=Actinomadura fibrosa TaxID=111802 RepID=A0ABW2XQI3_9ACTN|nr:adenylate/guanylate cyclase [Actinomadura fibrosa]
MEEYPAPGTIVVTDIEGFSARSDLEQRRAREEMYAWLPRAMEPLWSSCFHEDRGDGVLMLWPAQVPRAVVVAGVLRLAATAPAASAPGPNRLRMRVAMHAGDVYRDEQGFVGGDLNQTFRLSESELLRTALRRAQGAVAYLISDHVHHGIVRYGDPAIDLRTFHPAVVTSKADRMRAWLHIPGEDGLAARLAAWTGPGPASHEEEPSGPQVLGDLQIGGDTVPGDKLIGGGITNIARDNARVGVQGVHYGPLNMGDGPARENTNARRPEGEE